MLVLIGDDDAATRRAIRSALTKRAHCEVVEAQSGSEVLDILQRQAPDALVIEVQLPIVSGLDVLQILRDSPQFRLLPVVALTMDRDEQLVRRLIELGVQDLLLKPLDADRIGRLTASLRLVEGDAGRPRARQAAARLTERSTALIVDGDEAYRKYFRKAIKGRLVLFDAETGANALELCDKACPDVVFLGTNLGLVKRGHIAQRLRAMPRRSVQIVAVPHKSEVEAERASGLFDDVLVRTYVPAAFEKELERLLRSSSAFDRLRDVVPDIRVRVIQAAEQVFGTMLGTDLEPMESVSASDEPRASASLTIKAPQFVVTLRVRYALSSGKVIAGAFLETDGSTVADDDVLAVAGEVINVLAGRVKAAFQEREMETALGLPTLVHEPAGQATDAVQPDQGVDVYFQAIGRPVVLQIVLTVQPSDAAASATKVDAESGVATIRTDG
jgi:CheY-like chemotaxis protein